MLPAGWIRRDIRRMLYNPDWLLKLEYGVYAKKWKRERGWEYAKYSPLFSGRDVLEVGGGMGYDGMMYARVANTYTYAELNPLQLDFIKRVNNLYGVTNTAFELMNDTVHVFPRQYNAFYAHGVLHHVPFEVARKQFENIDRYLLPGSKVVMLMYPRQRWENAGRPAFEKFGDFTDGGCPWTEWYDEEKILRLTGNAYTLDASVYWGHDKTEFVNFELTKR